MPGIRATTQISRHLSENQSGIRVRVVIDDVAGLPDERLFRYLMRDTNPRTGERAGMFDGVCSVVEMSDLPADQPAPGLDPAWFRLNYLDVLVPTAEDAQKLVEDVEGDLRGLDESVRRLSQLEDYKILIVGDPPPPEGSSSVGGE